MDLVPNVPKELMAALDSLKRTAEKKADFIASQFNLRFEERQEVLSRAQPPAEVRADSQGSDTGSRKSWKLPAEDPERCRRFDGRSAARICSSDTQLNAIREELG